MHPAGGVDRQRVAEEVPFLDDENRGGGLDEVDDGAGGATARSPGAPAQHGYEGKRRPGHPHGLCKLTIFFALFLISVLALGGVLLSFSPQVTAPGDAPHEEDGHGHGHEEETQQDEPAPIHVIDEKPPHIPQTVHHNDDIPEKARLRDSGEYVLSPSWDRDAPATTREYHWTILDAELNPDGVYRPMILINNQFPGPLVECNEGDTIVVHVENKAVNATSVHFHGLFQNGTNAMDGTVGVTQCATAPNSNFTYQFDVRGQSGTYWYHAHHSAQASDGLLGPVVVHSRDELTLQELDYATDRIIMVQDHYHNTTSELLMDYLRPGKENEEPVPDNALINGRGMRSCAEFKGWRCDDSEAMRPVIDLRAGQRHRLRFINVGAFAEFQIQLDEHPFYVTEVDGTDVHPEPFHRLNVLPAQRYSIIVETNVTTTDAFWLRTRMVSQCFATHNERLETELHGIVRYISDSSKALISDPTSKDWPDSAEITCRDLNTSLLHPVQHVALPPADDFVILRANFEIGAWRLSRGFFNHSTWHMNATHPSLHRFLDAQAEDKTMGAPLEVNEKVFDKYNDFVLQTKGLQTVDISINNFDDGAHPFHLHGHKFFVLAQAQSGYPPTKETLDEYLAEHGGMPENPLRRDTVTVQGYSWALIRVVLDNPGLWTFHCHNTWHSESGMVMQLLVRSDDVVKWEVSPEQRAMCARDGVTTGIRPDDSIWFGDFGKH